MSGVVQKEMLWRHESNIRFITSAGRKTSEEAGAVQKREVWLVSRSVSKSVTACMRLRRQRPAGMRRGYEGICAATRANCILAALITDRLGTKNLTETIRLSRRVIFTPRTCRCVGMLCNIQLYWVRYHAFNAVAPCHVTPDLGSATVRCFCILVAPSISIHICACER